MTAALIIAAGEKSGKNRFQPEREIGTISAIQRIALLFQQAGIRRIVVICSEDDKKAEKLVPHMNLIFLHAASTSEMLDGIKIGLSYLSDKCTKVLVSHVDVPLFSVKTVQSLMTAKGDICVPSCHGQCGHPILIQAKHFQEILSYQGEGGLAGAIRASGLQRQIVEVEDEGVLSNTQKQDSFEYLVMQHDLSEIWPSFRFRLNRERPFYGPGAHHLLKLVRETGSLSKACRHMGISYSKGRKIISTLEQQFGYSVIESRQGGKDGGFSYLTKEAERLMQDYDSFCEEAGTILQELFRKHFFPQDPEKSLYGNPAADRLSVHGNMKK